MRVTREIVLSAPPADVWPALWDVPRMVECVPGCVDANEIEPRRRYAARMTQQVGPIRISVPLEIEVTEEAPGRLVLKAKGRDALIATGVSVTVRLDLGPREEGSSLRLDAEWRVLGTVAALGHPIIQRRAEGMVDEFADRLERALGR
jgi:carbon monoxide dehydrogenase subunit G